MRPLSLSRRASFACVTLTLLTLLAGCGGDNSTGPGAGGPGGDLGDGNGDPIPTELVGQWNYGTISPTNFWNDHTGQYVGNAYGVGAWFTFKSRGAYEQFIYIYTQSYSCVTQSWTWLRGEMTVDNDVITFNPTSGVYKAADNCIESHNFRRNMTAEELQAKQGEQWQWYFAENPIDHLTSLMMGWAGSGQSYYFKQVE